ncbi:MULTISPECIES: sulfotransferase family 2 domain-containing protein [Bacillus]|uniref:sulfotransferase family 2 domain-containing protein n=1 Tax=Bacillus TaxID=1386 RepID=UPI00047B2941|nr:MULTISPECIES: sulfotransferase family 2 domain-containing protein [Bacillus]QHZ48789.1 sulfotransferase family protein [Bacillus sp. NSP9.1]WFA05571.1 sulfotransferase family 2 domain-containing protein [Bacillus sp. HSf4]
MFEDDKLEHLIFPYTPLYQKDFPIILFWIPKSGCTTLNRWFFFQNGLWEDAAQTSEGDIHHYRNKIFTQQPDYMNDLSLQLLGRKKDTYKLVRNPFQRAVSSFLTTICSPNFICLFDRDIDTGLSFTEFLYHLKDLGSDIHALDRHLGPQYIKGEEEFVNHYIYLEQFTAQIREIENKYKLLKSPLSQLSKSPHHLSDLMLKKGKFADTVLTISSFDWVLPTYESFYNQETKQLVQDIFMKDFQIYGFDTKHLK